MWPLLNYYEEVSDLTFFFTVDFPSKLEKDDLFDQISAVHCILVKIRIRFFLVNLEEGSRLRRFALS